MNNGVWQQCIHELQNELSDKELNTWIRPLHAREEESGIQLYAPNRFVLDSVRERYFDHIVNIANSVSGNPEYQISLVVGSGSSQLDTATLTRPDLQDSAASSPVFRNNLNSNFTFST
ncbi:MAG: DnaA N-terminal domain-containing protein, partial [Gammaproteobacteria bacterium]|nr:DnaA N-terminal domain-containing protein [Gammaproteobacteria bacterium]